MWQAENRWEQNQKRGATALVFQLFTKSQTFRRRASRLHFFCLRPPIAWKRTNVNAPSKSRGSLGAIQIQSHRFMFHTFPAILCFQLNHMTWNRSLTRTEAAMLQLSFNEKKKKRTSFFPQKPPCNSIKPALCFPPAGVSAAVVCSPPYRWEKWAGR